MYILAIHLTMPILDFLISHTKSPSGIENISVKKNIARVANAGSIPDDYRGYLTKDLIITNGSPQWDVVEYGPVRDVNEPTGAFERFKERLSNKIIDVDLGDL